jgi:hypothetical protein
VWWKYGGTDGTRAVTDIMQVRFVKRCLKNQKIAAKKYSRVGKCVQNAGEVKY